MFIFSVLDQKNLFCANLVKKNQNCQFKLKFGTKTNLNKRNSMMMFTFSVSDHKYRSWANFVQKFKIICSKWNLIQRLIWICKIQWWCLFYMFYTENSYPFWKIWSKKSQSHVHFFVFSTRSIYFFKFFPKIQIVCWSWNLEPRLIWICKIRW